MRKPIDIDSISGKFGTDPQTYNQFGLTGHHGIDYPANIGTPVYAPETGVVTISSNGAKDQYTGRGIAGETIVVKGTYEHWLMHLNTRLVQAGHSVNEGQLIGYSGNTGFSTGPHLHWGTRPNNPDINNGYRGFVNPQQVLDAATIPPAPRFTVVEEYNPAKLIQLNKQPTNLWGMNFAFDHMAKNPIEVHEANEVWPVTNKVRHENGYFYYRRDGQIDGFNVLDCNDYTPPEPEKPKVWPTAPATATDTTPYEVVKLLDGYETSNKAANHLGQPVAPVGAGQYYIFNKRFADSDPSKLVAINVTTKLGQPGYWINPEDNVPDPEPVPEVQPEPISEAEQKAAYLAAERERILAARSKDFSEPVVVVVEPSLPTTTPKTVVRPNWRSTYVTFKDSTGYPEERLYVAMKDFVMVDQESTNRTAPVKNNDHIWMSGTFIGPDDQLYGMPSAARKDKSGNARYWYYGCPMDREYVLTEQEVYGTSTTKQEREVIKVIQDVRVLTNKEKNRQHALQVVDWLTITPKEMESFIGKAMDFFSGRTKKTKVPINKEKN